MEAIIFDVDGTLWDSTKEVAVAWNDALEKETKVKRRVTQEELKMKTASFTFSFLVPFSLLMQTAFTIPIL